MPKSWNFTELSLDQMLELLNPEFNLGRTFYTDPNKRWMIVTNLNLIVEVNCLEDDVDDIETFGYPLQDILRARQYHAVFGSTPRDCLFNFFTEYPTLILFKK